MSADLAAIKKSVKKEVEDVADPNELEKVRIAYVGRKGALTAVLRTLKDLPEEERKQKGEQANALRKEIEELLLQKEEELKKSSHASALEREWIDVTRPGFWKERGHLHPLTKIMREAGAIFSSLGFETVEGPEVETEWYNFDALNIPENHPARDMWDTFWLQGNKKVSGCQQTANRKQPKADNRKESASSQFLLRTHTSPVQIRYMETHNPPIRIIVPGRVYRYEATDASHDIEFYQLEGLMVDKNVSIANFKAIIQHFFSSLFKKDIAIRLRPSSFPFVEPGFEVDITCVACDRRNTRTAARNNAEKICSVCKGSGWLELAGAGMVHPHVFKSAGYNPKDVQGFAFGMGLDRLAMMKYKIPDIRLFRGGDIRFLKQF